MKHFIIAAAAIASFSSLFSMETTNTSYMNTETEIIFLKNGNKPKQVIIDEGELILLEPIKDIKYIKTTRMFIKFKPGKPLRYQTK